jgi:DNA (cytosine-5)-methyltransferase 1
MAGLRQQDSDKNALPWQFAKFVEFTQPKIAMLENVTGILRPYKDENGKDFHAWYEVAKTFASIGYIPLCLHVNARFSGVAQNRPRFIMIALRLDHYEKIIGRLDYDQSVLNQLFQQSLEFYHLVTAQGSSLPFGHLNYFDAVDPKIIELFERSFLAELVNGAPISVMEALDDLKQNNPTLPSDFIVNLNQTFDLPERASLHNHEFRNNSDIVRRRFRLYQVLSAINVRSITQDVFSVLKGEQAVVSDRTWLSCQPYEFLQLNGELTVFENKNLFDGYLKLHPTKKQTQKALIANQPAPAALSIPDDACHYDIHELRVLTVREMARIQSFPDNFVFRSKITTGGKMRKFEVPQYTQVGNAVPPLLARKLGLCLVNLLP